MRAYLVSPTYPVTGSSSYVNSHFGYLHPTRGRSVKFTSVYDTDFVRYAKTSEDIRDIRSEWIGPDNCDRQSVYIVISGESWRYLIDSLPDGALGEFQYYANDNLLKSPIIRIECQPYLTEYDERGQCTVEVRLPSSVGEVSIKIVEHTIQSMEITQDSFKPPKPEDEWWESLKQAGAASQGASNHGKIDDTVNAFVNGNLQDYINNLNQKNKEENNNMNLGNNLFKDLSFGKASSSFALSFDNHITFNGKYYANGALNDACGLTLDLDGLLYVMPTQELKAGDIVYKKGVDAYYYDGTSYISLSTGQKAEYVPTKVFGMTFYSVIKNLAGNMFGAVASKDNPMANMLPFLLLDRDGDNDDLLKFMLLSQGNFNFLQPQSAAKPESK